MGEEDQLIENLARGFSSEYLDAEGTVSETVSELREYTNLYAMAKGHWVAPYTSLITSSMMGKSRHMKQVANHLPSVYICLRGVVGGYGYPRQSPSIFEWSSKGAATIVGKSVRDYYFCFSTFRWSAFIISTIEQLAQWIDDGRFFISLGIDDWMDKAFDFAWLWKFFAEPPDTSKLEAFWVEVQDVTSTLLKECRDGISAHAYFQLKHSTDVETSLGRLRRSFERHQINDNSLPLIFIFDEARTLCEHEAYNGARIYGDHSINFHESKRPPTNVRNYPMPFRNFSNFLALRRAFRYLWKGTEYSPRVFAVFTDTTSRIANFQPTSWNDPSLRVPILPEPGRHQFPPIFVFSSVDVYSRVMNEPMCVSSPEDVADPERLLKFGRAGWYNAYFNGSLSYHADLRRSDPILDVAISKLLSIPDIYLANKPFEAPLPLTPINLIKLIAVLAPRLALTIGPFTLEASELIASHLAVLTRTDNERHFLRTVYPSEPILAAASARLTNDYGWAHPLSALIHYVRGGIVEAGFRGELITKIICLMAMDRALSSIPRTKNRWRFARPVLVSQFLNHLIVPLKSYSTFSEGLKGVRDRDNIPRGTLNVDDHKLRRFLNGHVFFNHFIRVDVKLSYSMLVHAWNRGAAIMCMTNTKGIDHVIPVMLNTNGDVKFGPLHGPWEKEHIQQARQHMSYILINSRNYASGKDQIQAAWATKFSARNLREYGDGLEDNEMTEQDPFSETESDDDEMLQEDLGANSQYICRDDNTDDHKEMEDVEMPALEMENVFMSLVQDFGKRLRKEQWIAVGNVLRTYTHPRRAQQSLNNAPLETQFIVVLKGIGTDTYECLKNNPQEGDDSPSNWLRERSRMYLKELTKTRVDYVDKNVKWKRTAGMQNLPLVYGDSVLGSANWTRYRSALQGAPVESGQPATGVGQDMSFDESMDEVESSPLMMI